jgi:hypothetical protein
LKALLDDQTKAMALAMGVSIEVAAKTIAAPAQQTLDLADSKYTSALTGLAAAGPFAGAQVRGVSGKPS